ncbi:PiggyBac transposable element-derived protein 4 [Plakobranchus ocellatus]|uniref:PiggyBac transposable element-derived protein 4 n=1 Tax=Plakobranchus ocellatus TaxID=259542 RepID=A0AAV3YC69_9GAST|nr:PiggyBac transposable element-derived protein 4 [Plakobranchus ocellatus]
MLEGKRSRGKQREKLIEGLTDWLKAGKSLEAIEATKDRKKWRTMIANAVDQAQILIEDLPLDLSEEEPDSDPDNPTYEPKPSMTIILEQRDTLRDAQNCEDETEESDGDEQAQEQPRLRRWKKQGKDDCSGEFQHPEELRGFIGLNIVMGYHTLPSYKLYWPNQPDLAFPLMPSTMLKTRFEQFLSNIHINNDMTPHSAADKMWKMRPLRNSLNENFSRLYNVTREQSIDESMILFKGRSCLKQYCKPIMRGFKMWVRADMDGYIGKFQIYQGKGTGQVLTAMD